MADPDWKRIETRLAQEGYTDERVLPLLHEIDRVRREKGAIILAHYYQTAPIQLIADQVGDSLALAQAAKRIAADGKGRLIVSSTVEFMAEMVKMLNPASKVVIPGLGASCSIAEGMDAQTVERIRAAYPNGKIVGYINSKAATLAAYDSACTSANARDVLLRIGGDPVILVPDYFLARNVIRTLPDDDRTYLAYERTINGHIVLHDPRTDTRAAIPLNGARPPQRGTGTCVVHEQFTPAQVAFARKKENADLVLAHPEVRPDVAAVADYVGSTSAMIARVKETGAKRIMVLSECNLIAPLRDAYPDREFVTPCTLCPYMRKNTLDGLLAALRNERWEITVPETVAIGGRNAIERMLGLTGKKEAPVAA